MRRGPGQDHEEEYDPENCTVFDDMDEEAFSD
jgi:hypothetical protein